VRRGLAKKTLAGIPRGHDLRVTPLAVAPRSGSLTLVHVPLSLRLILGSLLVLGGVVLLAVAVLGARSRLRRNRWLGVRTAATLRSEPAFTLANRVAAVPIGAAGLVAGIGGAVLLAGASGALGWVVLAVAAVGSLALAGIAGTTGDRAAVAAAAEVAPAPSCGGACAGCDLVAGCRDGAGRVATDGPRG
jgi:hypothetical protein